MGDKPGKSPFKISLDSPPLTVGAAITLLFPRGTPLEVHMTLSATPDPTEVAGDFQELDFYREDEVVDAASDAKAAWRTPPALPPDLFAIAGALLDWSGAAHHVVAEANAFPGWMRALIVSDDDRLAAAKIARKWRRKFRPKSSWKHLPEIEGLWNSIVAAWDEPVFREMRREDDPRPWWRPTLLLMMVADCASESFGFYHAGDSQLLDKLYDDILAAEGETPTSDDADMRRVNQGRYTISTACPDIVCVLPKSRTASVGCTLRSLSHNLALLPPRGLARANWHSFDPDVFSKVDDLQSLNVLLIPYPYSMPALTFAGKQCGLGVERGDSNWFDIEPHWRGSGDGRRAPRDFDLSPEAFTHFVEQLLRKSLAAVNKVGGIVFPESAMPYEYFTALASRARRAVACDDPFYWIEFIVAGTLSDDNNRRGNHAAACLLARPNGTVPRKMTVGVQDKHHRWRLDRSQMRDYGLGGALPGGRFWWERLELRSRALNVFNFRESSTFVALICEDLARLEPVHELVRSIGPNLVFALLLDGPQVSPRWPGRYAVGLSDDPGSSVLTLTSYGLVQRYNDRAAETYRSDSVGLWRDETGETRKIALAEKSAAILLSLSPERKCEISLDGRSDDSSAIRWVYADQIQISLDGPQGPQTANAKAASP